MADQETPKEPAFDWSAHVQYGMKSLSCKCGSEFLGYGRVDYSGSPFPMVSKDPCPGCGKSDQLRAIRDLGWEAQSVD